MPKLALITVLYKSDEVLEDFFSGISMQDFKDYKLYLVDNSCNSITSAFIECLQQKYPVPSVEHIDTGGNIGVAAGNNTGIERALKEGCEYLLFLNNDIFIDQPYLLSAMTEKCKEHKIVTPKIFYHDSGLIWMAGGYMDRLKALGVHYGMKQKDNGQFNTAKFVTYAPTCFLMVQKNIVDEIGLMDEKYFAYYDDTDFVFRAVKKGMKVWYEPSLYLGHKVSSSSGGDESLFYIYYGNRNKIYFIKKHFSGLHRIYLYIYYFVTRFLFYYLRFDKEKKKQLIKATKDGFKMQVAMKEKGLYV
jgi:hypothetical protein